MGYDIVIGNAVPHFDWDACGDTRPLAEWQVERETLPNAPNSDDAGQSNLRSPSYTSWEDFLRKVGLHGLFFDGYEGLMSQHPGTAKLTKEHAEGIEAAAAKWRAANPDAQPRYCECMACDPWIARQRQPPPPHDSNASGTAVRLVWLEFWVRWAVDNCEHPAIQNW